MGKQRGFSLLEIVISFVIITILVMGGMNTILYVRKGSAGTQQKIIAMQLAEKKMIELQNAVWSGASPADNTTAFSGLNHERIEFSLSDMPYLAGANTTDSSGLFKKAVVTVKWDDAGNAVVRGDQDTTRDRNETLTTVFYVQK